MAVTYAVLPDSDLYTTEESARREKPRNNVLKFGGKESLKSSARKDKSFDAEFFTRKITLHIVL